MGKRPTDKLAAWKTLSQSIVFDTPWFKIRKQHMRTPAGAEADYYIHDNQDSVICVCISDENKILVERQYRPPVEKVSVDYPAGRAEQDDSSTEAAIRRELHEETGFTARSIRQIAVIDKDPGFSVTRMHVFLARGSIDRASKPEETESIVATFMKPSAILDMIASGDMACTFCISATFVAFRELGWMTDNLPKWD